MARTRSGARRPTAPASRGRSRRGQIDPRRQWAARALALLLLTALALVLLAWAVWQVLLWWQRHPLAQTALSVSALLVGVLLAGGLFYWTAHRPLPGLRGRHPRRAALARYYHQRSTLHQLQTLDPVAFERFVGRLFECEGYEVEYTPRTGDDGVDLRLRRPQRRIWGARQPNLALVQCKRYGAGHAVGAPELHNFSGALRHELAYEGYVVTTSFFTPSAQAWASAEGIHLIDGLALLQWQRRLRSRVR
jgi:hypothetical protein